MIDLLTIQERHQTLYDAFLRNELTANNKLRLGELKLLLQDIEGQSKNVASVQDYRQLHDVVEQWRKAGPALQLNLRDITLLPPSPDQLAQQPSAPPPVWPDSSLHDWLVLKASEFSKNRALAWSKSLSVDEIVRRHRESMSEDQAHQQANYDWSQAELYLASYVIDGQFDLVRSLTPESYRRLEGEDGTMWLQRVKQLKAYMNWKSRGEGWGEEAARADYAKASREIVDQVFRPERKAPQSAFLPIQEYIEKHFLAKDAFSKDATLDPAKERTKLWLEVKARRLSETRGVDDPAAAEDFMRKYYENIITAVLGGGEKNEKSTRSVIEALGLCSAFSHYDAMVNCFEMALAIYFLDPQKAQKAMVEASA
ncbi:MAG: hypothetical protein ACXV5J_05185 [Candidatus Angelobacter sp.]